jgi:glutaredoxin
VKEMDIVKVAGKNSAHKVIMYAISTCAWCKLTKKFLKDSHIEYEYVDVDLCSDEDREKIRQDILKRGGRLSYPAIIIDDKILINGFQKEKITEALQI